MEETTATNLRANLFKYLERAARGIPLRVKTKSGSVILGPDVNGTDKVKRSELDRSKLKFNIVGSLKDADEALRAYIRVPK